MKKKIKIIFPFIFLLILSASICFVASVPHNGNKTKYIVVTHLDHKMKRQAIKGKFSKSPNGTIIIKILDKKGRTAKRGSVDSLHTYKYIDGIYFHTVTHRHVTTDHLN